MKKIKYRQYYYNGNFSNLELEVPDECRIYEVGFMNISHKIEEGETKAYVFLCPSEIEDSKLLCNVYLSYLDDVFIENSEIPIQNVEEAPRFENAYMVRYYKDAVAENKISAILSKIGKLSEASEQDRSDLQVLYKESKGISEISKLRRITYKGIEIGSVYFKNWIDGTEVASMAVSELPYGRIWFEEFSNSNDIAAKFKEEADKIYNSIINY
jgi:hypothetical protein